LSNPDIPALLFVFLHALLHAPVEAALAQRGYTKRQLLFAVNKEKQAQKSFLDKYQEGIINRLYMQKPLAVRAASMPATLQLT